uniref:Uncharacterized protein n=1 Tax=Cacopsylla melanoneura TaxID=428564 RepID=A0A8D8YEL8_9HEMI
MLQYFRAETLFRLISLQKNSIRGNFTINIKLPEVRGSFPFEERNFGGDRRSYILTAVRKLRGQVCAYLYKSLIELWSSVWKTDSVHLSASVDPCLTSPKQTSL